MTRHALAMTTGGVALLALLAGGCRGGGGESACPPGAPHDLKVDSISGSSVVISWVAGSGAPTSHILEAGSAPGKADQSRITLGAATTYTATGVKPGTYYARIIGVSACGSSPASNEIVAVVK
jgi:hypothetical protein